jgi:hypothetical protein
MPKHARNSGQKHKRHYPDKHNRADRVFRAHNNIVNHFQRASSPFAVPGKPENFLSGFPVKVLFVAAV